MTMIDPRERIELQASWACNIAREWRTLMDEARVGARPGSSNGGNNVIYLREVLHARRKRRFGGSESGPGANRSNVVLMSRGPRHRQRG